MEAVVTDKTTGESSGICCYQRHPCSRPRYKKYKFCAQHILEDTSSPFTSCGYISRTSGRKCPNPALRSQKVNNLNALCREHLHELIVKEQHQKQKRKLRKKRKSGKITEKNSAYAKRQKLIDQLARYSKSLDKPSKESSDSEVEEVHRPITDDWPLDTEDLGSNADWDDFDPVNNEVYEPLRYADVLTPEEVVATAQSKLIRLQSLYIEQFKRLFHLLKERRRQYLYDRRKELAGTSSQAQGDGDDEETEENYALATYRRRTGVEALLRKKQLKHRQEADGNTSSFKPSITTSRCSHISNHTRCKEHCLPYTKYCRLHILSDPHQQLYKKCHCKNCVNPVCILTARVYEADDKSEDDKSEDIYFCTLHAPLPKFTFKFPEPVKEEEEEMVVHVETAVEVAEEAPDVDSEMLEPNTDEVAPPEIQTHEEDDTQPIQNDSEAMEIEQTTKTSTSESAVLIDNTHFPGSTVVPEDAQVPEQMKTLEGSDELESSMLQPTVEGGAGLGSSKLRQPSEGSDCAVTHSVENKPQPAEEKVPEESSPTRRCCPQTVPPTDVTYCHSDGSNGTLNPRLLDSPISTTQSALSKPIDAPDDMASASTSIAEDLGSHLSTSEPSVKPDVENDATPPTSQSQPDEVAATDSGAVDLSKGPEQENVIDLSVRKADMEKKPDSVGAANTDRCPPVLGDQIHASSPDDGNAQTSGIDSPVPSIYLSGRGERKPSSAEEELAVVSLLSLCSGHPSDDNTPSSSTEQE